MKIKRNNIVGLALGLAATLTIGGVASFAAEKASGSKDAAVERTRQEVKMLDDLFKNTIVLIDGHYVKTPSDFPAATAAKALWAAMKKGGWYDVRIVGLLDVLGDPDDAPKDAFEKAAAIKLLAGETPDEEVVKEGGKRYLRVMTGIPVVSEHCVMCHENFRGNKGNIGALSYTVPLIE